MKSKDAIFLVPSALILLLEYESDCMHTNLVVVIIRKHSIFHCDVPIVFLNKDKGH
jgi:hypothetical protein